MTCIRRVLTWLLTLGFVLSVPAGAREQKLNMSYLYFGDPSNFASLVSAAGKSVDEVAPCYFSLNAQGALVLTSAVSRQFVKEMHDRGVLVVPYLSNDWDRTAGVAALDNREALADALTEAVLSYDLDGVNIDIENVPETRKNDYTEFLRLLRARLPAGKRLAAAVAANPYGTATGWIGLYDYARLGEICDYLMIMAYDENYAGGKEGPVSGISFVENSIRYALRLALAEKIVLGIPFYGRIWSASGGSVNGLGVSNRKIDSLIRTYRGTVRFDEESQTACAAITVRSSDAKPVINGKTLSAGTYHIWFSNEQAIKEALKLVTRYGLRGTGSWSLGQETVQTWDFYTLWLNGCFFTDVTSSWAKESILDVFRKGWMDGVSGERFAPQMPLTRAQAATVLVRAAGLSPGSGPTGFTDCGRHWAEGYIATAQKYGVVSGVGDNRFEPDRSVTRAEIAVMLNNLLGYTDVSRPFPDVPADHWAYSAVLALKAQGILKGYGDGNFLPQKTVLRAETAALLSRVDPERLRKQ